MYGLNIFFKEILKINELSMQTMNPREKSINSKILKKELINMSQINKTEDVETIRNTNFLKLII